MDKEKHICSGFKKSKGLVGKIHSAMHRDYYKCNCNAVVFENEKWWCKKHAPSKIKEREEKSWQTYLARIRRNIELNS